MKAKKPSAFSHKKSLGQHFLINQSIQHKIIQACSIQPDDNILEIGPGFGALTHTLCEQANHLYAVEKDKRCADQLKENLNAEKSTIYCEDFLKFDLKTLPKRLKVVGNLPYNVASPIIEKIIEHRSQYEAFYFMVQLEFGRRLTAKPNSKDYGSLSCFIQYYTQPKMLFKIANSAFQPRPKVQSCFIQMNFLKEKRGTSIDETFLFQLIRCAFSQRRKMIQNVLTQMIKKDVLEQVLQTLNIDGKKRAEHISLEEYIQMAGELQKAGCAS